MTLVERLRADDLLQYDKVHDLTCEAADRIEQLEAALRTIAEAPDGDREGCRIVARRALEGK